MGRGSVTSFGEEKISFGGDDETKDKIVISKVKYVQMKYIYLI
jgi:hypothetical protein